MRRILPILEEPLGLIRYLRSSTSAARRDATQLRRAFDGALSRSRKQAEREGLPQRDIDDVYFAIVVLIDEIVLAQGGSLANDWMRQQLQLAMFGENRGGESFFERLSDIRRDSSRVDVLLVYYLVLSLGFRGKHAGESELALHEEIETIRVELERRGKLDELPLSPSGGRPKDPLTKRSDARLVLGFGAIAIGFAAILSIGLSVDLGVRRTAILDHVRAEGIDHGSEPPPHEHP